MTLYVTCVTKGLVSAFLAVLHCEQTRLETISRALHHGLAFGMSILNTLPDSRN